MNTIKFKINGLHCMGCVKNSESILKEIKGVKEAKVKDPQGETELVTEGEVEMAAVEAALKDAGYSLDRQGKAVGK